MNKGMSLILVFLTTVATACEKSPVGTWQLVSAKEKNPNVVIELWEEKGQIQGKIRKITPDKKHPQKAELEGQKVVFNLQHQGHKWAGGKKLDIEDQKLYNCEASLSHHGHQLLIRSYSLIPAFGSTEVWQRIA